MAPALVPVDTGPILAPLTPPVSGLARSCVQESKEGGYVLSRNELMVQDVEVGEDFERDRSIISVAIVGPRVGLPELFSRFMDVVLGQFPDRPSKNELPKR